MYIRNLPMNELIEQYRQGLSLQDPSWSMPLKNNWDNLELTDEDLKEGQYHRPEMLEQILLKGKREKEVVKLNGGNILQRQ